MRVSAQSLRGYAMLDTRERAVPARGHALSAWARKLDARQRAAFVRACKLTEGWSSLAANCTD